MAGEKLPTEYVVGLDNIGKGAALVLFDTELRKVLDNIADVNTSPKTKRKITLTLTLAPTDDRTQSIVSIDCKSTLAQRRGEVTTVYLDYVEGRRAAVEANPLQSGLFDKPDGRVVPLGTKKGSD